MYANTFQPQSNRDYNEGYRNRGRGGHFNNRGGRGRGWSCKDVDFSKITFFRSDKNGNLALDCLDGLLKLQETCENKEDETHEADGLLMHEVVYLNERNVKPRELESGMDSDRIWYLDNGARNHMTGNHSNFNKIDETITGKVRFGDDSRIDIKGK